MEAITTVERTAALPKGCSRIQDTEITFHDPPPMAGALRVHPALGDNLWDIFEVDVQKPNSVYSNLREYVRLC